MMIEIGNKVIIKYNGDIVNFGQCYDGMTGNIDGYAYDRYQIILDFISRRKINEINYRTGDRWSLHPTIPFKYVYAYNKNLEIE